MDLASSFENVDAFLRGNHRVAIEVCGALFELREVFHRLEGALRAEQPLHVYAAQRGRVDTVPELLRPCVSRQVSGAVGVAVGVAIEAGYTTADVLAAAIFRLVELLLRKRRQQEAQTFDLLGVEQAVKELIEVV